MSRGDRTRERILDVAQERFAAQGVSATSLRQIRLAAGQRNEAAVRYHFGDKNGVIAALSDRHTPRVQAIQDELVRRARRPLSLRLLVEALVRPQADYLCLGPGERAWIRILAELLADPQLSLSTIQDHSPASANTVGVELFGRLSAKMPAELAADRIWAVALFSVHLSADRARLLDAPDAARGVSSDDAFAANLVDMALGALTAPVSRR